ncbi:MAG: transcriptional regulator [Myxococcota bacterium]
MSDRSPPERTQTDRQRLLDALSKGEAFTVPELSKLAGISQQTVQIVLDAMMKGRVKLTVIPPKCVHCGFTFEGRSRSRRPSKCPKCRKGRIVRARFAREGTLEEHND